MVSRVVANHDKATTEHHEQEDDVGSYLIIYYDAYSMAPLEPDRPSLEIDITPLL